MLSINFSELILTIINFFLLLFLLKKFLYDPILKFTAQRQERIDEKMEQERLAQAQVDENAALIAKDVEKSVDVAKDILKTQRSADESEKSQRVKELKAQTSAQRQSAKVQAEELLKSSREELAGQKQELAQLLADKLLDKK